MGIPKYHKTITNIQELVDIISKDTASTRILGESIEEYVSIMLDEILDSNPDMFGETNHISYFKEKPSNYEVAFENIGKVQKCVFSFKKDNVNLEEELVRSLWGAYSYKMTYEQNRTPDKNNIDYFAKVMRVYFDPSSFGCISTN
jgi:hypothetical protein